MITKAIWFISIFGCVFSLGSMAQSDTLELSLSQAMDYATEFGYQSVNAQHDIDIARKKVNETLAIGLPQITGSGTITNNLMLQENLIEFKDLNTGETQRFSGKFGTKYNNSVGGRVDQLLFDGSYFVGLQASKVYVRLSEDAKEKTDIELKQAVAEAYFLTLIARQNIEDFSESLKTNKRMLEHVKAYYENGFREDIDVDQVRLIVNESQRLYDDSENQYKIAKSVLKFVMGYDIDKPLKLSDSLLDLLVSIPEDPDASNQIQTHIDYRMILTQMDAKGLEIKNQKAQAMPKLNAFLTYDYAYFGQSWSSLTKTEGSMLGLSLSVPIFSSGMRTSQLNQKKLELNKLNIEKRQVEENLKRELFAASCNLSNARKQFENARQSKEISNRIYDKSTIKFKNGLMNSLELAQNENSLIEAILNYNNAAANYFNQFVIYKKASSQL
ncbi:TolC family protein [Plebeiibacterium marinum]|uniref:TolC family protein n=1 Tax=Plebeiibacterium marinum TaxID=2992111 RepID=A0AAE3MF70_9BACT|nr:TolC family protein [Plebeiobacterium marinum]MCW3806457.1 TolC family protein [Plebeiobacterium marinum]